MNCSICGKYKYVPKMVLFKTLDNRDTIICKFCLDTGYSEMDRATDWLPRIDLNNVQESVSVDPSKDHVFEESVNIKEDAWIKKQTEAQKSYLKKMADRGMITAADVLKQMDAVDAPDDGLRSTNMNESFIQACMLDARSYSKFVPYSTIEYWRDCLEQLMFETYMRGKNKGLALAQKKNEEEP